MLLMLDLFVLVLMKWYVTLASWGIQWKQADPRMQVTIQ